MSLFRIFDIAGSGMSAQSLRLNVTASNLANAGDVSGSPDEVYRARHPVFEAFSRELDGARRTAGVRVLGVVEGQGEPQALYQPGHPEADENGYVYASDVNPVEEMINMLSASRSYQNSIEVLNTSKDLLMRTLTIGQ